jgi:DNA-binding CsgD family transcriptional regulator
MPSKVATDLQERLAEFRGATSNLERDRAELLERIRQSLKQLRTHRQRLVEVRRRPSPRMSPADHLVSRFGLTAREVDVALLLADGCSNAEVSRILDISSHTARHHTGHVLAKLAVHTRAQAGALLRRTLPGSLPGQLPRPFRPKHSPNLNKP